MSFAKWQLGSFSRADAEIQRLGEAILCRKFYMGVQVGEGLLAIRASEFRANLTFSLREGSSGRHFSQAVGRGSSTNLSQGLHHTPCSEGCVLMPAEGSSKVSFEGTHVRSTGQGLRSSKRNNLEDTQKLEGSTFKDRGSF